MAFVCNTVRFAARRSVCSIFRPQLHHPTRNIFSLHKFCVLSKHVSMRLEPFPSLKVLPLCSIHSWHESKEGRQQKQMFSEDRETTALALWQNVKELKSSPVPALMLGLSGLLPFVGAPGYMVMSNLYLPHIALAQVTYGAVILSFLGGVRWGFVIPDESKHAPNWFNLSYSVAPSLVAWTGLLMPHPMSLFTIMIGLAGVAYFDMLIPGYPPWFKGLRFVLSFVAILSLWTTFMCNYFLKNSADTHHIESQK